MKLAIDVCLKIESAGNFRQAELLRDLQRVLNALAEPEPTRKAGRTAWNVAEAELGELREWRPESHCSFCGEHITSIADWWTTDDGTIACTDTSAPFVPHKEA